MKNVDCFSLLTSTLLEGYSTMCGHATIALGCFFIDTHDKSVFPRRSNLPYDPTTRETLLRLHVPCGVVHVGVPTLGTGELVKSDPSRPVTFSSVPSFASGMDVDVEIPDETMWVQLEMAGRNMVTVDIAFGGAYYAIVSAAELGFTRGIQAYPISEFDSCTRKLKGLLESRKDLFTHPSEHDLEYLYGVIVVEQLGTGSELGLCFFANQQVDRSPTGSGVCARVALSVAKGKLDLGQSVAYESLVSLDAPGNGFVGKATSRIKVQGENGRDWDCVQVEVSGKAFYTGAHSFVVEAGLDSLGEGVEVRG